MNKEDFMDSIEWDWILTVDGQMFRGFWAARGKCAIYQVSYVEESLTKFEIEDMQWAG